MNTHIIIMGHNYMSRLGLIRACGEAGYKVTVIAVYYGKEPSKKEIDAYSKYVTNYLYTPANEHRTLVDLLLKNCKSAYGNKPYLIPASDFTESAIDMFLDELLPHFILPNIYCKKGKVVEFMDKNVQKRLADQLNITNAKSWIIHVNDGKYKLPDNIMYPCFPKAAKSTAGGKFGMRKCDDEKTLHQTIDAMISCNCDCVLVEQYLSIDQEYAAIGYSDGTNVCIPGIIKMKQMAHGLHKGVAVTGELIPNIGYEKVISSYESYVKASGFVGLFDIDFFECGGTKYFGEMNMRVGASADVYLKSGINLVELIVEALRNNFQRKTVTSTRSFINERMADLDWYSGYMSSKEFLGLINTEYGFLHDSKDTAPISAYRKKLHIKIIKRMIKKLIRTIRH